MKQAAAILVLFSFLLVISSEISVIDFPKDKYTANDETTFHTSS